MGKHSKIDAYLDSRDLSKNTRASYRTALIRFEGFCRQHNCYTVAAGFERYEKSVLGSSLSETTKKAYMSPVRAYVRWVSESKSGNEFDPDRYGGIDAAAKAMGPRIRKADVSFVCRLATRKGEAGYRDRAIFLLALTAGMTTEEIAAAMPEDLVVDGENAWITVKGSDLPIRLVPAAKAALLEYLDFREPVRGRIPLVAASADGKRRGIPASDVRKRIDRMLELLSYRYEQVFHGDSRLSLVSVMDRMDADSLRRVADYATSLYYSDLDLGEGAPR